jgi:peptidoglycan LD-endopeptidase LytH
MSNTYRPGLILAAVALTLAGCLAACDSGATTANSLPASPTLAPSSPIASSPTQPVSPPTSAPLTSAPPTSTRPRPTAPKSVGTPGKFVFPVVGHYTYAHTHHDYPATDIITNCGNEVRAATSGVILEVTRVDKYRASVNAGATRGGLSVSIKGDDGVRYYGSHLEEINKNIQPGVRVAMGEMLGKVGRTGDASACHLHFGISPVCSGTGDWWIQRGILYPWPYLDSWREGGDKSPVAAVRAWEKQNGCPKKPLTDP